MIWEVVDVEVAVVVVVVVVVVVAVVVAVVAVVVVKVVIVLVVAVSCSRGKISGQIISKLLQSFAPTTPAVTSENESGPFGKSDLKKQFLELEFQLNNLQFTSFLQSA